MLPKQMSTIPQVPAGANRQTVAPGPAVAGEAASQQALVPSPQQHEVSDLIDLTGPVARLPVELDVSVPVRNFRVRNLLALEPGRLIESQWGNGADVPISAGDVQLAWSEFEVIDSQLAVRITRLA
jgi:flagellar motor switch/type III secretory pathway protein FliN